MPTKQDIDKGIAVNMGGVVPSGHGLAPIRQKLLDEPRERQWVIGQVVNNSTKIEHPAEADDKRSPTMVFVDMTGITDTADCDQLAAMANRARARLTGQRTFDEADAGDAAGDETADSDEDGPDEPGGADDDADGGTGASPRFLSAVSDE